MNTFPRTLVLLVCMQLYAAFSATSVKDTVFWRTSATFITPDMSKETEDLSALILEDNRLVLYSSKARKVTRHRIVHILSSEGLNDHNKVVIYVPGEGSIIDLKARSISSSGKVTELNQNNIKDITNYDEDANLKIFAIEGAEVGGQIEYSYTLQTPVYDAGIEEVSTACPTQRAYFVICGGDGLYIATKAYNWPNKNNKFADVHWYLFENVVPLEDESYSSPDANSPFVEYKIRGTAYGETTYSEYEYVVDQKRAEFSNFNATEKRKLNSLMKHFDGESTDEQVTLRNLNAFLKTHFYYEDNYSPEYSDVLSILKSGVGNDFGLAKVYCLVLSEMGINYEVLITCDKYSLWLDPDYCSRFYLNEYVIHFPDYHTFIYPSSQVAHYGIVPSWLEGNTAVVVSQKKNYADFMLIKSSSPENDQTNLTINVNLDLAENFSVIDILGFGTGQVAYDYNSEIYFSESEEEKQLALKDLIEWRYPDGEIVNAEMIDPAAWGDISTCQDYLCKRSYKATIRSHSFYEKVGTKLLLNVGKLIGPQTEMYSEKPRIQPITCDHNKSYSFEINIRIPDGYKYSGNQNTEIENVYENENGTKIAGFSSKLEVTENQITIRIYEYYSMLNISLDHYEDYRKIINSSANFNKATILLEKIQ
ncbi:MAG: DUF3857 domain-containing protein [Bacteroidetes bacterium]|nr:DUF3857 domain-containing protein [Bacteroidota bacterium]